MLQALKVWRMLSRGAWQVGTRQGWGQGGGDGAAYRGEDDADEIEADLSPMP